MLRLSFIESTFQELHLLTLDGKQRRHVLKLRLHPQVCECHFDECVAVQLCFSLQRSNCQTTTQNNICYCFWATVCKTVCPMLLVHWLSVLSVCLWRWCIVAKRLDGGRPRLRPHCVTWGLSSAPQRVTAPPNFWSMSIVAKWLPTSASAEHLLKLLIVCEFSSIQRSLLLFKQNYRCHLTSCGHQRWYVFLVCVVNTKCWTLFS